MLGLPPASGIDVLSERNAAEYWERSDRFDMALDLTAGRRGHAALGEVLQRLVGHLLALEVEIEPLTEARDVQLAWYVGLDADGTKIGDTLWHRRALDEATAGRIVALYRLRFHEPQLVAPDLAGEPVYLILAMTPDRMLRVKPQNLLVGLPIRSPEPVS
jgi:hypothetical protein